MSSNTSSKRSSDSKSQQKMQPKGPPPVCHIRRCHVCGHVNVLESAAVHKCGDCGKHLAPFYYFDESKLEGLPESGPYLSRWKNEELEPGPFQPMWGLSSYWQDDDESNTTGNRTS